MKDMFYNYDHANTVSLPALNKTTECNGTYILKNIKDDILGIAGKNGSEFSIYFNIDSLDALDEDLYTILDKGEFTLNILNKKREIIKSLAEEKNELELESSSFSVRANIDATVDSDLDYGVYYLQLNFKFKDKIYTIFSDTDGILWIY